MLSWVIITLLIGVAADTPVKKPAKAPSYFHEIRPVLQRQCQGCHQPAIAQGSLDVTTFERFAKGGAKGPAFRPGAPEKSLVVGYLTGEQKPQMPFGAPPLAPAEIEMFRKWIAAGAKDDTPAEARDTAGAPRVYRRPPMINALAWSPDGKVLAVSGYREVLLHAPATNGAVATANGAAPAAPAARLAGLSDRIHTLLFSPDGKMLIAAGGTPARFGEVQFWDVESRALLRSVMLTSDTVFGASLAPDGARVAVGGADNTVRVLDADGEEKMKAGHHENWVLGTAFGVDGKRLVSVGRDRAAKLTDAASGAFLENINLLREPLYAVTRHPRRDYVLVGGEDRFPYLYTMDRARAMKIADDTTLVRRFEAQGGPIFALAFSPDGDRIAAGGAGNEVGIYETESGRRVAACTGHNGGIFALAFRPGGQQLAAAGFDGVVRIYDTATGKLVQQFIPVPLEQ